MWRSMPTDIVYEKIEYAFNNDLYVTWLFTFGPYIVISFTVWQEYVVLWTNDAKKQWNIECVRWYKCKRWIQEIVVLKYQTINIILRRN